MYLWASFGGVPSLVQACTIFSIGSLFCTAIKLALSGCPYRGLLKMFLKFLEVSGHLLCPLEVLRLHFRQAIHVGGHGPIHDDVVCVIPKETQHAVKLFWDRGHRPFKHSLNKGWDH